MNISIGTQQFNNHTSRVYIVSFISSRVQCLNTENRTFYLTMKLKLNVLYTILALKNLSAVSRHPCRTSISVFREKRKKAEERCAVFPLETATLVKKICISNLIKTDSTYLLYFLFFGETLLMCRFKTLANACRCPEMP